MTTSAQHRYLDLTTLRCAAGTDVGMHREENQDAFGIVKHDAFQGFFLADGMGGVKGGAIAARLAIAVLQEALPPMGPQVSPEALSQLVSTINTKIFEQGATQPGLAGMGTTLVGLVFTSAGLISLNVGDSRAYRIRGKTVHQMSEDHTLVRELVLSGTIKPEEAEGHPVSHMLTRSLGPLAQVALDCRLEAEAPEEGDIYVLCSDGLYNFVQSQEILDVVQQNPLDDANQILINLANRRGGSDNITVIVVAVGDPSGRGRGSDYRKARSVTSTDSTASPASPARRVVGEVPTQPDGAEMPYVAAAAPSEVPAITPPPVEEPRDHYAEREMFKGRKRGFDQPRGIPVTMLVCGAVLFGLVVGDVARRWIAFPDIGALFSSNITFSSKGSARSKGKSLYDLSKELSASSSDGASQEGLPDIARRVREGRGSDLLAQGGGSRQDRREFSRNALEGAAGKIEQRLSTMRSMAAGSARDALERASKLAETHRRDIAQIETQIDAELRKLSIWFGSKRRLELGEQELFNSSGDLERIGATSDLVKKKISEYTEATYRLQAKQDELELYPGNEALQRELEQLRGARTQMVRELQAEMHKAVDLVLADTYKQLENLKARRDELSGRFHDAQEEVRFLQVVASPDAAQREELRRRLEDELRDIRIALEKLG